MSKITKVKLPKKGEIDHYFVISDIHAEMAYEIGLDIFFKHAKLIPRERRRLIINGDIFEAVHLMAKGGELRKMAQSVHIIENVLIPDSEIEFKWVNDFLDRSQNAFDHIYFVLGNHGHRYNIWKDEHCPFAYRHNFDVEKRLGLKGRGIPFIPYTHYLDIGDLTITHGSKHGKNHNKQMYEIVGSNILYGHVHHFNCTSYERRGKPVKSWSAPCMCGLAPAYQLKRGENNWTNGYAHVAMRSNGNFNLSVHEIFDDMLVLPSGKVLDGK